MSILDHEYYGTLLDDEYYQENYYQENETDKNDFNSNQKSNLTQSTFTNTFSSNCSVPKNSMNNNVKNNRNSLNHSTSSKSINDPKENFLKIHKNTIKHEDQNHNKNHSQNIEYFFADQTLGRNVKEIFDSNVDDWTKGSSCFYDRVMKRKELIFVFETTGGNIIGFYLSQPIDSQVENVDGEYRGKYIADSNAFLLKLNWNKNENKINCEKYPILPEESGNAFHIYNKDSQVLLAIGVFDLCIYKKDSLNQSYCNARSYKYPDGKNMFGYDQKTNLKIQRFKVFSIKDVKKKTGEKNLDEKNSLFGSIKNLFKKEDIFDEKIETKYHDYSMYFDGDGFCMNVKYEEDDDENEKKEEKEEIAKEEKDIKQQRKSIENVINSYEKNDLEIINKLKVDMQEKLFDSIEDNLMPGTTRFYSKIVGHDNLLFLFTARFKGMPQQSNQTSENSNQFIFGFYIGNGIHAPIGNMKQKETKLTSKDEKSFLFNINKKTYIHPYLKDINTNSLEFFDERDVRLMKIGNGDIIINKGRITSSCLPTSSFNYHTAQYNLAKNYFGNKLTNRKTFVLERIAVYKLNRPIDYCYYQTNYQNNEYSMNSKTVNKSYSNIPNNNGFYEYGSSMTKYSFSNY